MDSHRTQRIKDESRIDPFVYLGNLVDLWDKPYFLVGLITPTSTHRALMLGISINLHGLYKYIWMGIKSSGTLLFRAIARLKERGLLLHKARSLLLFHR